MGNNKFMKPTSRKPRGGKPQPLERDRWMTPGTRTFAVFFPELNRRFNKQRDQETMVTSLADAELRQIVVAHLRHRHCLWHDIVEEAVQELKIRVAEMDACTKYDPRKGKPLGFLSGIARQIAREVSRRNSLSLMPLLSSLVEPCFEHDAADLTS